MVYENQLIVNELLDLSQTNKTIDLKDIVPIGIIEKNDFSR